MNVDHPHPERGGGGHRAGHRVRNVVELEIEEDPVPPGGQGADGHRSRGGEELTADLETADAAAQRIGETQRLGAGRNVERDQELIHACPSSTSDNIGGKYISSPWRRSV